MYQLHSVVNISQVHVTLSAIHIPIKLRGMVTKTEIGSAVRRLREAKNMTMDELAFRSQINQGNLSKMETGKVSFTFVTLTRVAKALSICVTDIVALAEMDQAIVPDFVAMILALSKDDQAAVKAITERLYKTSGLGEPPADPDSGFRRTPYRATAPSGLYGSGDYPLNIHGSAQHGRRGPAKNKGKP
jgi:transcriptional regulator with XRE-family HTH domain